MILYERIKHELFSERSLVVFHVCYIVIVLVCALIAFHHEPYTDFIYIPLFLALVPIAIAAIKDLSRKHLSTEFFIVFATIFGLYYHQEQPIMVILGIMIIAQFLEHFIMQKTENALQELVKLIPSKVMLIDNEQEIEVPLSTLQPGVHIRIKTGQRVAVDGIVASGFAMVNEAPLTGESTLRGKGEGDLVYAGSFLESGTISITVKEIQANTLLGKMMTVLATAQREKSPKAHLVEFIAQLYTITLLIIIFIIWITTHNSAMVIALFIFGSPLELVLVTPLTLLAGMTAALRQGVLIKGGAALEAFTITDTIIFDKTGTLTLGEPTVVNVRSADPSLSPYDILTIAAIAEKQSDHVIGKALRKKIQERNPIIPSPQEYISLAGHGISIAYKGIVYFFGNQHFIEAPEHGNSQFPIEGFKSCPDESLHSIFYLASQGRVIGKICATDMIQANAYNTLQELRNEGIRHFVLLSGDRQEITEYIAHKLGIKQFQGNVMPEEKLNVLKQLQVKGHSVAMVGDGINDALALQQADVGIAMGAMGMEPAIYAANIVLMSNDLSKITFIRKLATKTFHVIRQNLILGFFVFHGVGLILTLTGFLTPAKAALAHAFSDLIILLNASRLILYKGE